MINKKSSFLGVIAAIALTFAFSAAITGCAEDEGGISLPGNKKVSELPTFDGTAVSRDEADALLTALGNSGLFANLRRANDDASSAAFKLSYTMDSPDSYLRYSMSESKLSPDYSVSDTKGLKDNKFASGTIKGSSKMSISSNKTFTEIRLAADVKRLEDITISTSSSNKRDIDFTGYENSYTGYSTKIKYKATGFLHIENSESDKIAYKKEEKYDSSSKSNSKTALAVSFSCSEEPTSGGNTVTKGAKILVSFARDFSNSGNTRSSQSGGSSDNIYSIELYDNNNVLICKKDGSSVSDIYLDFLSFDTYYLTRPPSTFPYF